MEDYDSTQYQAFLHERRIEIEQRMQAAAASAGRWVRDIDVVAVSKTVDVPQVVDAWAAGWHGFAENRPQELTRKLAAIRTYSEMSNVRFDLIGNLQKNKINQVLAASPKLIHSVSSPMLAQAISTRAAARNMHIPVLLEVNVSGEATKSGMDRAETIKNLDHILDLPAIEVQGLMTMAPANDPDTARCTFSELRELAEELRAMSGKPLPTLSCGMSDDFEIAIQEGSTLVRLGRVVFDPEYQFSN